MSLISIVLSLVILVLIKIVDAFELLEEAHHEYD